MMKNKVLTSMAGIIFAGAMNVQSHASEPKLSENSVLQDAILSAIKLAEEKRFTQSLETLETVENAYADTYDFRFARARLLTWSGQYTIAGKAYQSLISDFPNNPDILVSVGYLELFRGNLNIAETHFSAVIESNPVYMDAYRGLERTYALRQNASKVSYKEMAQAVTCPVGQTLQKNGSCIG